MERLPFEIIEEISSFLTKLPLFALSLSSRSIYTLLRDRSLGMGKIDPKEAFRPENRNILPSIMRGICWLERRYFYHIVSGDNVPLLKEYIEAGGDAPLGTYDMMNVAQAIGRSAAKSVHSFLLSRGHVLNPSVIMNSACYNRQYGMIEYMMTCPGGCNGIMPEDTVRTLIFSHGAIGIRLALRLDQTIGETASFYMACATEGQEYDDIRACIDSYGHRTRNFRICTLLPVTRTSRWDSLYPQLSGTVDQAMFHVRKGMNDDPDRAIMMVLRSGRRDVVERMIEEYGPDTFNGGYMDMALTMGTDNGGHMHIYQYLANITGRRASISAGESMPWFIRWYLDNCIPGERVDASEMFLH